MHFPDNVYILRLQNNFYNWCNKSRSIDLKLRKIVAWVIKIRKQNKSFSKLYDIHTLLVYTGMSTELSNGILIYEIIIYLDGFTLETCYGIFSLIFPYHNIDILNKLCPVIGGHRFRITHYSHSSHHNNKRRCFWPLLTGYMGLEKYRCILLIPNL